MFDWWDWGHSMEKTTDALAGINPFMGYAGGIFFIIGAVLGLYMLVQVIKKKENDMFITLLHFVSGATVFMMIVMQLIAGSASGDPMHPSESGSLPQALLLAGVMLAVGGFIWRNRLNNKRSVMLIYAHVVGGIITGTVLTIALLELSEA